MEGVRVVGAGICLPESRGSTAAASGSAAPYACVRPQVPGNSCAEMLERIPLGEAAQSDFSPENGPRLSPAVPPQEMKAAVRWQKYQDALEMVYAKARRLIPHRTSRGIGQASSRPRPSGPMMAIDMALPACRDALEAGGTSPEEVDLILSMSLSPDHLSDDPTIVGPRIGHPVQRELGAKNAFVFDLVDADWTFAIDVAQGFCKTMGYRRALLVRAECNGGSVLADRSSGFAVPDGAGALVLAPTQAESDWNTTYVELPSGFEPLQMLLPPADILTGTPYRAALTLPYQPGLCEAITDSASKAIGIESRHHTPPDAVVPEIWLPGQTVNPPPGAAVLRPPESLGHLGPFSLPWALSRGLNSVLSQRVLHVTFNPFQMRCGCQQLLL